jgi:hypothetical protein
LVFEKNAIFSPKKAKIAENCDRYINPGFPIQISSVIYNRNWKKDFIAILK